MIDNMITVYNKTIVGDYREAIVTPEVDGIGIQDERGIITPITPYNYEVDNWSRYIENPNTMVISGFGSRHGLVYNYKTGTGNQIGASSTYWGTIDKRYIDKIQFLIIINGPCYSVSDERYQPCIGLKNADQVKNYSQYNPTDDNWIMKARGRCWQEDVWDEQQQKYVPVWRHSTKIEGEFDVTNLNTECLLCMCAHGCNCSLRIAFEKED